MTTAAPLSTIIDARVKKAAMAYCKQHGLKFGHLVERGLVELLEDAIDLEAYEARRDEPRTSLAKLRATYDRGVGKKG